MTDTEHPRRSDGMMRVARSRGALSGLLLVLLGAWGALIPFIGPTFNFAFTPANSWDWTAGRFWLEVLPGLAAVVGGLMLMVTANRAVGVFAGYLASAAGAWFIVGPLLGRLWGGPEGAAGTPVGSTARQVWEQISFFDGVGAVILFLAAQALGRFTVRSVRDVRASERRRDRKSSDSDDHDASNRGEDRGTRSAEPQAIHFAGNRTESQSEPARATTASETREIQVPGGPTGQGSSRAGTDGRPQG